MTELLHMFEISFSDSQAFKKSYLRYCASIKIEGSIVLGLGVIR